MSPPLRAFGAAWAMAVACPALALAQTIELPAISVTASPGRQSESLVTPPTAAALQAIQQTPGAVALVSDEAFKNSPAMTLKDITDWVAGVMAQPKWGEEVRLSIRGSGLSRNFHLRSVQLFLDGIPINTADGYGDFQEIDPTAYRYVEIYKGANALRYGANALGGAINFVTPTGRDASRFEGRFDAGSFGFLRGAASSGAVHGPFDYFITGSWWENQGYRAHSDGHAERGSANLGYRLSENVETRFFVNANSVRQRIPGEVSKQSALVSPRDAAPANVANDWQRNIDTLRLANKTTVRFDDTTIELGLFGIDRHLMHPIFQWLDYRHADYGATARLTDERMIGGYRNRLIVGANLLNGETDARQYVNIGGRKGTLRSSLVQQSENFAAYAENALYVLPTVSLVAGTQYVHAERKQTVLYSINGDVPGRTAFDLWSPKGGVVWEVDPAWQVFANVSRSAEVPSFGERNGAAIPFYEIKAQTATTYEIGTRGRRTDHTWDFALYHADIRNELQCFYSAFGNCNVTNADRTIHRGVEAAWGVALWKSIMVTAGEPDRLWLNAAYTYNDFRYDNDATFGNNRLPGAPPHYLRAELMYRHPGGFSIGPNLEWVPQSYYVDSANTLATEPYVLWGLKASYEDARGYAAYVEARNLGNTAYIATTSVIDRAMPAMTLFNPGDGRAVFVGVRGRL